MKMISLFVEDGLAYVWNSEDWNVLRSKHRICGALIGSAPPFPRQNDFMGLPLALMAEEAALLVDKGICELYELPNITEKPSEEQRLEFKKHNERCLLEQNEAFKRKSVEQLSQKIDIILAGKKQKLLSKGIVDVHLDKHILLEEEIKKKTKPLSPAHLLVHLPTQHNILDTEKKRVTAEVLKPPVTNHNRANRYAIFRDLWERGYYITYGSKFGSDFLLYPGDPVRFHSTYMVWCMCDPKMIFYPTSLVAFGRLAVSVNKLGVLAVCNEDKQIEYQTIQWHK